MTDATHVQLPSTDISASIPAENGAVPAVSATPNKKRPARRKGPNYALIHSKPLPLETFPLPAFNPSHPGSVFRLLYHYLSQYLWPPSSHKDCVGSGVFSAETRSVHVTDPIHIRALWEMGFFGKGLLSRSEPSWMAREQARLKAERGQKGGGTAEEATRARREERRKFKLERARLEREKIERQRAIEAGLQVEGESDELGPAAVNGDVSTAIANDKEDLPLLLDATSVRDTEITPLTSTFLVQENQERPKDDGDEVQLNEAEIDIADQEHLQLTVEEAFFLAYGLGALTVYEDSAHLVPRSFTTREMFKTFSRHASFPPTPIDERTVSPDNAFVINYVVYHHFRSLGWVVRPGVKFSVDYLLYNRGPVFSHAEFAVLVVPSYGHSYWKSEAGARARRIEQSHDWWWLHCVSRVQSQVRKTLVLAYVDIPPPTEYDPLETDIGELLRRYTVREFVVRRWVANRSRD